jgi:acyl carrier protein
MGLDGVELVMALEEAFGVELSDDEVYKSETPRIMSDVIFAKLRATDKKICQTQRAFYILRRALMKLLDLKREEVTLDLRFRDFVSKGNHKEFWQQLQSATKARKFPDLARPIWLTLLLAISSLALLVVFKGLFGFVPAAVIAIAFGILSAKATRPFRVYIPMKFITVRDLVAPAIASDEVEWTRGQVSDLVKKIVLEQLGISETDYAEDASFVDDYAMDR